MKLKKTISINVSDIINEYNITHEPEHIIKDKLKDFTGWVFLKFDDESDNAYYVKEYVKEDNKVMMVTTKKSRFLNDLLIKIKHNLNEYYIFHDDIIYKLEEIENFDEIKWYKNDQVKEKYIKTYESYNNDDKIWIIGIPSGEALQVTRDGLSSLNMEELVKYTTKLSKIGFFAFEDEDIDLVKRYVEPKIVKPKFISKDIDINIFDNNYDQILIDTILNIIDNYNDMVKSLYVQDDGILIDCSDDSIEIKMNFKNHKYMLVKKYNNSIIDRYNIANDTGLIKSIDNELSKLLAY